MKKPGNEAIFPPWWLAASLFVLATVILFGEFIFSDRMLYGEDTLALGYMARAFFVERITAGDFPLWAPRLLGGVPTIEAIYGGDAIYPTSLLYFVTDAYRALGWKLVLHVLGGGFFMYGWARSLGLGRPAATVGGLAWLMAPVIVTLVLPGNDGKLMVASLAPLVFWATESVMRSPSGRSAAGLAGAVAVVCLTTQFQTAYFLFGSVGAYAVFRAVSLRRAQSSNGLRHALLPAGLFLGSAVLGAGIAAVQLVPAADYVTQSSRRIATTTDATSEERITYASSWSYHPEEVAGLVVPEFVGNSSADAEWGRGTYWGRNAVKLNHEYLGVTVIALAIFGFCGRRRRGLRWFMAGLSLTWLLYALGTHTPFWRIFYEVVPGIDIFRVPAISAFLVSFGVTTLCALGVDDLLREAPSPGTFFRGTRGRALLGFAGLLFLGLLLQASGALGSMWMTTLYSEAGRLSLAALAAATPHITRGFGIAVTLAVVTALTVWAVREGKIPPLGALGVLVVLVAADLGRIDRAFISTLDYHAWAAPNDNTRFLEQRRNAGAPFRVADMRCRRNNPSLCNRGNDQDVEYAMHGFDLLAGHHPNDLARYRQLLGLAGSMSRGANTRNRNVLRMMNVQYLLWSPEAYGGAPYQGAQPLSSSRGRMGPEAIYAYPPGLDRAWIASEVYVMEEDDDALARILSSGFDPGRDAILAEPATLAVLGGSALGPVAWELYEPDLRRLRVTTTGPALLVISENWFPGWVAEVNGQPSEVRRANVTLQAVEIPAAGDHTVTLRFTAPTVRSALRLSIVASVIALLLFGSSWLHALPARLRPRRGS